MNLDKFTNKAVEAIGAAQQLTIDMQHQELGGEHLHLALIGQDGGLIPKLLGYMNVDINAYKSDLEAELERRPKVQGDVSGKMYATRRFNKLLSAAADEAKAFKDDFAGVEHMYIALLKETGTASNAIFKRHGIEYDKFMEALNKVRSNRKITSKDPEATYDSLARFGRDLVELAKAGKLDPVIGRDAEIRRAVRILTRRTKNNPVLIGEPGRGQNRGRGRPGPAHTGRRRARGAQRQNDLRAGHGRAHRRGRNTAANSRSA